MTFVDFKEGVFFMKSVLLEERVLEIWNPGNQFPETAKSLMKGGLGVRENRGGVSTFYPLSEHRSKPIIFSGCVLSLFKSPSISGE